MNEEHRETLEQIVFLIEDVCKNTNGQITTAIKWALEEIDHNQIEIARNAYYAGATDDQPEWSESGFRAFQKRSNEYIKKTFGKQEEKNGIIESADRTTK